MVNCIFVWECSGRDASSRPSLSCDQLDQCPTKLVILQLFLLGLLGVHLQDDHLVVLIIPDSLSFSVMWPVRGMPNQTCISSCTLQVLISPDLEADQATVFNPLSYSRALHKVNVSTFGAWRSSHHQFSYFTAVTQSSGHRVNVSTFGAGRQSGFDHPFHHQFSYFTAITQSYMWQQIKGQSSLFWNQLSHLVSDLWINKIFSTPFCWTPFTRTPESRAIYFYISSRKMAIVKHTLARLPDI